VGWAFYILSPSLFSGLFGYPTPETDFDRVSFGFLELITQFLTQIMDFGVFGFGQLIDRLHDLGLFGVV
jgi:hypothetical protein